MNAEDLKRRYSWQCRRGLLEVDVVLNAYLENHFLNESDANQQRFGVLLEQMDPDLFEWFTRRSVPPDQELADYVLHILQLLEGQDAG